MSMHNPLSPIHDIKETTKRTTQFCYIAMIVASATVVTNIVYGNSLSTLLVLGLIAVLGILLWVNKKSNNQIIRFGLLIVLNIFLVAIALAEGLDTASTFYFLPLLFAIPFFIENTKRYRLQVALFFSFTFACFLCCILFCDEKSTWQFISDEVLHKMFIINGICSFLLCAIFACLSMHLERKYARALLNEISKKEEAMQARTRFLSNMGHELRTPLNGIIGATNLLRKHESLPGQNEYLAILKYCSDHMLGLVNDILDFNKIEAGQLDIHPVECNIKKVLQQSILPFYNRFEEKKLELRVTIDKELDVLVLMDDMRLVQVINNLLSNALKFTEKGYVLLQAKKVNLLDKQLTTLFLVEDTGIGISKQDQQKVFGSFWQAYHQTTRKYTGTGLGLTISQRLLQMMETYLTIESEEGKGSKFYFSLTLPLVENATEQTHTQEFATGDLEGVKVLLAEDNIINAMIARKILEEKKVLVHTAANGEEVLQLLRYDCDFDLILLDLEMPVMDGYTAIAAIQELYPHIPVLAFTAALMDQDMYQNILDAGFLDFIMKPFQIPDFYFKVRKYAKSAEMLLNVT